MGTRTIFRLAVGICLLGAVSAQYPFNSLYRGSEKDLRQYRPQPQIPYISSQPQNRPLRPQHGPTTPSSAGPEESNDPAKFAKIMKQINKVNDDGSYTFGFENDDGSFRVETRSKDGLVKGKYGFVDANGQLKVTEYTAGEKSEEPEAETENDTTESEEEGGDFKRPRPSNVRSLPLSARPQVQGGFAPSRPYSLGPQPVGTRHVVQASPNPYRIGSRSAAFDQAPAAQTTQGKVSRAPPTSDDDFQEDEESDFAKRQSQSQEDNLNGQYFRSSVTQAGEPGGVGGAPARGRFPGGRPLYAAQGGPSAYAQQYPGGFAGGPQGFPQGGPQGFPAGGPQGFPVGGPQGFGGPQYAGVPQGFPGGFPQGAGPQGFRRLQAAPQDFSSIGSPRGGGSQAAAAQGQRPVQSIQNFGGFGGFDPRQTQGGKGNQGQGPADEQYIPSVELDGYSEDLDEDGYPDEPPKDGKLSLKSAGGASPASRPFPIQGGIQSAGGPSRGAAPQPQLILQLGQQGGSPLQGGAIGGGRFPGGASPQGGQGGLPPQYIPQQNFGGFPGSGQGFPQGFPQGFEGQGFGGPQGFPQQYPQGASGQPPRFGESSGAPIQGEGGFPFEFSPFGGSGGFPGAPQGFPSPQGFPGAGLQGGRGSPQQVQSFGGFPGAGGPQGFPVGGPNRFSSGGSGGGGAGGAQSFSSGGLYGSGIGGGASPGASSSGDDKKQ